MSRRLIAVNALLVAVSLASAGYVARELIAAPQSAQVAHVHNSAPASIASVPAAPEKLRPGADAIIATRNLFSPTRTEAAVTAPAVQAPLPPKPNLYGVVLGNVVRIAYLEDPLTKRVAGYRVGDPIAGGTVQTISDDRVVVIRPDGPVSVVLRDAAKPRPAVAATPASPVASAPQQIQSSAQGAQPEPPIPSRGRRGRTRSGPPP